MNEWFKNEIFYRLQSQAETDYNEVNTKKIKRKLLPEIEELNLLYILYIKYKACIGFIKIIYE
jgi:hypothetical protein